MIGLELNRVKSSWALHTIYKMRTVIFSLFVLSSLSLFGQKKENLKKGIALMEYDPVSYFQGNPKKGSPAFKSSIDGATYYFSSKANQASFVNSPQEYLPQYGGWCAYAMGLDGSNVEINPTSFKMLEGKLYLFYKTKSVDTKSKWDKNEKALKSKADSNWNK
jgi:YHS domain-containing protein